MSKAIDKVSALEKLLEERDIGLRKKIRSTAIIYAIVVVFVAAYTLLIIPEIKKWTSPEVAAEIAGGQLAAYLATLRSNGIDQIKSNSDQWAKSIVQQTITAIPQMEKPALKVVDDLTDYMTQHVEHVLVPAFTGALKENAAELKDRYSDFRDDEKMQGLALIFVEIFEIEMDKYVNDRLIAEIDSLRGQLRELSKPAAELTKKQAAQRQVLVNWIYLSDNQQFGDTKIARKIDALKEKFLSIVELESKNEEFEAIEVVPLEEL